MTEFTGNRPCMCSRQTDPPNSSKKLRAKTHPESLLHVCRPNPEENDPSQASGAGAAGQRRLDARLLLQDQLVALALRPALAREVVPGPLAHASGAFCVGGLCWAFGGRPGGADGPQVSMAGGVRNCGPRINPTELEAQREWAGRSLGRVCKTCSGPLKMGFFSRLSAPIAPMIVQIRALGARAKQQRPESTFNTNARTWDTQGGPKSLKKHILARCWTKVHTSKHSEKSPEPE